MSQEKKFIKTTDKEIANKLMFAGYQFVSQSCGVYTFINQPPHNFSFDDADKKKLFYTNMISI